MPLLAAYLKLFNSYNRENADAQKKILLKVLDDGIAKMNAAQEQLGKSSASFNSCAGKLTTLQSRFEYEFDEKSEFVSSKITQMRIIGYSGGAIFGIPGLLISAWILEGSLVPKLMEKLKNIEDFYVNLKGKVEKAFRDIDEVSALKLNQKLLQIIYTIVISISQDQENFETRNSPYWRIESSNRRNKNLHRVG